MLKALNNISTTKKLLVMAGVNLTILLLIGFDSTLLGASLSPIMVEGLIAAAVVVTGLLGFSILSAEKVAKDEEIVLGRIRAALDITSSNIMMADHNNDIVYANKAVLNMLRAAEEDIRTDLPNFSVDKVVGSNVDVFHKNPAHQQAMLKNLHDTYETSIEVGGRTFDLIANPVVGDHGQRLGTVVEWQDVTQQRLLDEKLMDCQGQVDALNRSQASIQFDLEGNIQTANDHFLNAMSYSLDDIKGKHHRIFVEKEYAASAEYKKFWEDLAEGKPKADQYIRYDKNGNEVWIQATYNPVLDNNGKPFKVVKYAVDVTYRREESMRSTRIQTSLDYVTSNVMLADENNDIIYANDSVIKMLRVAQDDIRKDLPNFDVDKVVGSNIDIFHKNPAHQQSMVAGLKSSYETSIVVGGRTFDLIASPIFGDNQERLGTVVEWQDVTERRAAEARSTRIQTSLDYVTSNVMLADENNDIIYANSAVLNMLRNGQEDIRKDLPSFDVSKVIGSNIDVFHKNPSHQQAMVESLKSSYETSIVVGGRTFNLIASPIFGANQERLGTVVEWKDVTIELAIEEEVNQVVEASARGDFTRRLSTEGKTGFMLKLAEGINQIGEICLQGLSDIGNVISAMSEGNLTKTIERNYEGMFDEIKQSLNSTIISLARMVGQIKTSASTVNSASNEISSGSADLSQRTERQASTLEETAASMEELTGTVRQNGENAKQANSVADQASNVATKGGEVVENAVQAMSRIEDSSKKISDIIGVIDEIAFQTNLLALNAAVEAARAGDAGKGFAVVASEVRTLAGRSAAASKDIKTLIGESVEQVAGGSELVNEAGETLKEIVNSVQEVAKLISDIAEASIEQTTAIEEINTAVAQMDEGTQQNAALVEENTAAAQSLVEQSEELEGLVSFFTLEEEEEGFGGKQSLKIEGPKEGGAKQEKKKKAESKPAPKPSSTASDASEGWEEF